MPTPTNRWSPRVVVIDFGRQWMYYMLHRVLLTESLTIYVMAVSLEYDLDELLNCESTDDDLPYTMTHKENLHFWLNSIYGRARNAPIVIVCTKADLAKEKRNERVKAVRKCVESSVVLSIRHTSALL